MDTVVKTRSGSVRGSVAGNVLSFKGIPYAAPPFGPNRFQAPQPVAPWDGVRDALAFGPTCPKPPYLPPYDSILTEPVIAGEDCLNLNVWTPERGDARLPVMVWIHGGSFTRGSNAVPGYNGSSFARDGVVYVSINYRLGVDGFLFLSDGIANRGLLDQLAALQWVQENIAAFGGDPDKVTLFGESAGSFSVSTLLSMPPAAGLFRRAIAQSGAGHHATSLTTAQRLAGYLSEKLGGKPTREAMSSISIDRLLQAQMELGAEMLLDPNPQKWGELALNQMPFEPVIDGEVLTELPIKRIAAGSGAQVEMLVGTNAEEWRFFMVPNGVIDAINDAMLTGIVTAYGLPVEQTLATYRTARPDAMAGDLMAAIVTDWFFRIPAVRLAEARVSGAAATYMYEFAWRSLLYDGRFGACHAVELPFVFDALANPTSAPLIGTGAPPDLAETVHAAWVAFAQSGNPGWPRYDQEQRPTMRFDVKSEVVCDPRATERALWQGLR
ncbi:MAG: carboxylesterase/lipase family protein [Ktedonobacterales bacterium]